MKPEQLIVIRDKFLKLREADAAAPDVIVAIEKALMIVLPGDFKSIAAFYSGGLLGGVSHAAIAAGGAATNIVDETLRLRRSISLPRKFVFIAEPPESLIVLSVDGDTRTPAVIWCDATDAAGLSDLGSLISPPQIWLTYADFIEYLLQREEEEINGDAAS